MESIGKRLVVIIVSCLTTILVAAPCFADVSVIEKGDSAQDRGNYDDAITWYRRAIAEEPMNNVRAMDRLFRLYAKLHRYEEAQQSLVELVSRTHSKKYQQELAELYKLSGNFYAAQRVYEDLISQDAGDEDSIIGVGECLEATGNLDAARDCYSRVANGQGALASLGRQKLARMKNASSVTAIDVDAEIGKWPADRMPLKVFIYERKDLPGYRSHLRDYVVQAIADWNAVARGLVRMEITNNNPDTADIVVSWIERLPGALGVCRPEGYEDGTLKRALIVLACNTDSIGKTLPAEGPATRQIYEARDRMAREVTLHEFGHALGLEHSPRNDDIMANGVFGLNSIDVPSARQLQPGDMERLVLLYKSGDTEHKTVAVEISKANGTVNGAGVNTPTGQTSPRGAFNSSAAQFVESDPRRVAMRDALFNLNSGNYDACLKGLKKLIGEDPHNAQAHYLLAVALVNLRQYTEAAKEYRLVLKIEPEGKLATLANAGLSKIKQ